MVSVIITIFKIRNALTVVTIKELIMKKFNLILFAGLFLMFFSALNLGGQTSKGWQASKETIERLSKPGGEFNYSEEKVPAYTLPPILVTNDGRKVTDFSTWAEIRRLEILEMFRENVFGKIPETPYMKSFKVISIDKDALNGAASLKKVEITITSGAKSLVIHLSVYTPNNTKKPVPLFLLMDCWTDESNLPSWKKPDEFFPVKDVIERGYGIAEFGSSDIDPDSFDNFKDGIHGILDKTPRPDDAWGTLAAWAWGASRCLDYLITDKDVAGDKVALVGFSRGGKSVLWAGAEDQRFAMIVAHESGAGGAALARRRLGETVARLNSAFPHWFCTNYKKWSNNEQAMPFDMHMLLALTAPRALYIDCADEDLWGDPRGSYLSLYNALPVYNLKGTKTVIAETMPPLNTQVISGKVGFHIRDGLHNLLLKDWNWFMDFADVELK
jgi:hypothetical protein